MAGWLDFLRGGKSKSADNAKERLKLVLIHDRTDLSPKSVESMKNEILDVISRYIEIDPDAVVIRVTHEGREQRLVADIPLKSPQRRHAR